MDEPPVSADLWRATVQHSPIGMALVSPDGRVLTANQALADMVGHDVDELARLGFRGLTHPDDLDADLALFHQTLAGEIDSYRLRKRYLHARGHVVWGDLSVALVRGPDDSPLYFISQVLDVTEQQLHEKQLEAAKAEVEREHQALEAIFETVSVGLLLIDSDGHYERMNRRHAQTMSLPYPEGHDGEAGQPGLVYLPDGTTPMATEDLPTYRAHQGEEFDDYTYWVGGDPASRAAFSVSARQVRGPSGEPRGAALAYQEITDLMRAMKVQDEFVASMSHELRTPLTSVLGYLEMLCDHEGLPPDVTIQLNVVRRNALRLRALLSDLLHVGQASEGNLELHRAEVDVAALVREAAEASQPDAARAGVGLSVDSPDRLLATVDGQRIRQVIDNLLSNAVKYSDEGDSVHVVVSGDARGETLQIQVSDTGMGIAPDDADRVFSRFFRGGRALEQHIPGTGLGLNIVSSIVGAHDGSVTVDSEVGRGSTFRVTLPWAHS